MLLQSAYTYLERNIMRRRDQARFALELAGRSAVALAMLAILWPVVFVPGLWEGYTYWNDEIEV